jgi:formylglycine-generating enzyme
MKPNPLAVLLTSLAVSSIAAGAPAQKKPIAPVVDMSSMIEFPQSSFAMGWPAGPTGANGSSWFVNQQPQHTVSLSDYWLDIHEVTVADFALYLSSAGGLADFDPDQPIQPVQGGYLPVAGMDQQPMRQVTWQAASNYCVWAGKRLPTEAEWERAAAGNYARIYPWTSGNLDCLHAVSFTGNAFCEDAPVNVGSRAPGATPEGVFDLAGGVAEWTADWYALYTADSQTDPTGPSTGTYKVVRGGGFLDGPEWARAQARWTAPPTGRSDDVGFRCAYSQPESVAVARGTLSPPADVGRQPYPRPYATPAPTPIVVASGLNAPTSIAIVGNTYYVLETGTGRVLTIDATSLAVQPLMTGLTQAGALATDGTSLAVTDTGGGNVWSLSTSGATTMMASSQSSPHAVAIGSGEVYWATSDGIYRSVSGSTQPQNLVSGLDGVNAIALSSTTLFFAEAGTSNPANAQVGSVPRAGGPVTTLVPNSQLSTYYYPADVMVDSTHSLLYFPLTLRQWPVSGLICNIPLGGGNVNITDYTPPGAAWMAMTNDTVYWTATRTLANFSFTTPTPFGISAPWTNPGGIAAGSNYIVWTDQETGRVYRVNE